MKNSYEQCGEHIAILIPHKTMRLWAHIDKGDLCKVSSISGTWGPKWNPTAQTFYARWQAGGRKNRRLVSMHRFIMDVTNPKVQIDHDDHDGLNNRRSNLKLSDVMGNGFNRRGAERGSTSGKRNVYWNARERKWMVWVVHYGKRYYAGYFVDVDAADKAAQELRARIIGGSV